MALVEANFGLELQALSSSLEVVQNQAVGIHLLLGVLDQLRPPDRRL